MTETLAPKETVSFEELLMGNAITQETIVRLLDSKGLLKKEEVLAEIKRLNVDAKMRGDITEA